MMQAHIADKSNVYNPFNKLNLNKMNLATLFFSFDSPLAGELAVVIFDACLSMALWLMVVYR